eukprot:7376046-Prymnesium_polylepis.1
MSVKRSDSSPALAEVDNDARSCSRAAGQGHGHRQPQGSADHRGARCQRTRSSNQRRPSCRGGTLSGQPPCERRLVRVSHNQQRRCCGLASRRRGEAQDRSCSAVGCASSQASRAARALIVCMNLGCAGSLRAHGHTHA